MGRVLSDTINRGLARFLFKLTHYRLGETLIGICVFQEPRFDPIRFGTVYQRQPDGIWYPSAFSRALPQRVAGFRFVIISLQPVALSSRG